MKLKLLPEKEKPFLPFSSKRMWMMKLNAVFLTLLCMQVSVAAVSQKLSLTVENAPLEQVMKSIKERSNYYFVYNNELLQHSNKVSFEVVNGSVEEVLAKSFESQPLTYILLDNTIVVKPKAEIPSVENELDIFPPVRVKGYVTNENGESLPGVSIVLKGTGKGTVTGISGDFELDVPDEDAVLVFSFIGYSTQEVKVASLGVLEGELQINISLMPDIAALKEVVVTALGIERDVRSLGYSVGKVDGEALNETPQTNLLNSLSGKVSGVQISQMDGAIGSSVNIIIRGANSLNNDNQPLFVIDGVPVENKLSNAFGGADMGNSISDINPNDVANISVLKGPSAAALYGSRAGNGVVLITTKSGEGGKKGIGVSLNSSVVVDFPYHFLPVQNKFGSGKSGAHVLEESENENWGPQLDAGEEWELWNSNGQSVPLVSYPNRFKDFFQTGTTFTNNVAVNGNYQKGHFRLSVGNMENKGVIPNTDLSRLTMALNTSYRMTDKLSVTANVNITESGSDNRPIIDGGRNSPVRSLYETGAQVNILDLKQYWVPGFEGIQQRKYKEKQNNPYFIIHENPTGFDRDRLVSKLQLDYKITSDLAVMARYSQDSYEENMEAKKAYSNFEALKGGYQLNSSFRKESNADLILSYNRLLNNTWDITAMAGGNRLDQNFRSIDLNVEELVIPGIYTAQNGAPGTVNYNSFKSRKLMYGVYASASVGYKDIVYLDLTARNDWSSTLPKENRSYFYPSASISAIISEMVNKPEWLTLFKVRAGSAQVGNDVDAYSLVQTFSTDQDWGTAKRMYMGGLMRNTSLKPEISTSKELGADVRLFNDRLGFEATYYQVENRNQVLSIGIPIESGANSKLINAGLVQSKGFELGIVTTPVLAKGFRWDMTVNISRNRTTINELAEGIEYFAFESYSGAEIRTYVGGEIGDIFMRPVLTVKDQASPYFGFPLLTNGGLYQTDNDVKNLVKIGNFNHDFMVSFQPSFSYKAFSLFANIDWRQGGQFFSNTMMFLGNNGQLTETLSGVPYDNNRSIEEQIKEAPDKFIGNWVGGRNAAYGGFSWPGDEAGFREEDASFNVGVRQTTDAQGNVVYVENFGGSSTTWLDPFNAYRYANRPFPDRNLYSATYVKVREIALAFNFPTSFTDRLKVQNASLSIVGNNLFQWTAAGVGVDPERAFRQTAGSWSQGVEYYNVMPWTGSVGVKLNLEF